MYGWATRCFRHPMRFLSRMARRKRPPRSLSEDRTRHSLARVAGALSGGRVRRYYNGRFVAVALQSTQDDQWLSLAPTSPSSMQTPSARSAPAPPPHPPMVCTDPPTSAPD